MNYITLEQIQKHFGWKKQYCEFFLGLFKALLACLTVSPTVLSAYTGYKNRNSACKPIRRFLKNVTFDENALARFIAQIRGLYAYKKWVVMNIKLSSEQKAALEKLHKTERDGRVRDRIKAVWLHT